MKNLIISVAFFCIGVAAQAQISGKSIPELRREAAPTLQYANITPFRYSILPLFPFSKFQPSFYNTQPSVPIIYSYNDLAFFCKIEVKMEKAVKFPIKFRLGDVEYVDRLEGKRE